MNKTTRRDFIKRTFSLSAGTMLMHAFPFEAFSNGDVTKITILHTNDVHSHIDPFPLNDPKWPGLGGVTQRAALIKKIRAEEKHVLLLDSGDIFQGTPYFNMYEGELELKLMSEMGYDATTIGNHDFDNGMDGLLKQMPNATFPFLCANYNFNNTILKDKTKPYHIFKKGQIKIGVYGLGIELKGLVDSKLYGETEYQNPLEKSAAVVKHLKYEEKCDLIICLSHLGYKYQEEKVSDVILASQSKHIDLIIGAHTHTLLAKPLLLKNSDGKPIIVAQVGWAGIRLGKVDFIFESRKLKSTKKYANGTTIKIF